MSLVFLSGIILLFTGELKQKSTLSEGKMRIMSKAGRKTRPTGELGSGLIVILSSVCKILWFYVKKGYKERIVIDPKVHFGKPCVAGTRIPVENVLELIQENVPFDEMGDKAAKK